MGIFSNINRALADLSSPSQINPAVNANGINPETNPMAEAWMLPGTPGVSAAQFADELGHNIYGKNLASAMMWQGSPTREFGDLSNQAFTAASGLGDQPWTGNALSEVNNQLGQTNPFTSFGPTSNPNGFNKFAGANNGYSSTFNQLSKSTNPFGNQIANSQRQNPFTSALDFSSQNPFQANTTDSSPFQAQTSFNNPYLANTNYQTPYKAQTSFENPFLANTADSNPFLDQFQNFAGTQNPYFDKTVDKALGKVSDRVNSQFGLAGRTGSGAHQQLMTESLGDVATQMYSDNYGSNMDRLLSALGQGAGTYANDQSRNLQGIGLNQDAFNTGAQLGLQGMGMNIDAANAAQGLNLQGTGLNQDAYNTNAQLGLQGTGLNMDAYNASQNRNLQGIGLNQDAFNADQNRNLASTQTGIDAYNADEARRLSALTTAGDFFNQDQGNRLNAANSGASNWLANQQFNMDATGANADLWQQGFNNQFNTQSRLADLFNLDQARSLEAAGMLPGMQNSQIAPISLMSQLGGMQDDQAFNNAMAPWNNLQNYTNIVASLGSNTPMPDNSVSNTDRFLNAAVQLGAAGLMGKYF